jgi:hypothetical protein
MQEHFVASAAREGVRIGVRANNFDCYNGAPDTLNPSASCTNDPTNSDAVKDRKLHVQNEIRSYLSTIYDSDYSNPDVQVNVYSEYLDPANTGNPSLFITVQAPNIHPPILSALVQVLLHNSTNSTISNPGIIYFETSMEYEDPEEFVLDPRP